PETPAVLSVLVLEDLAMAIYLPLVAVLVAGDNRRRRRSLRFDPHGGGLRCIGDCCALSKQDQPFGGHQSDKVILLTIFGAVLLVAGLAQRFQVSSAIGAFVVGIAVSGSIAEQSHRLPVPLRDLFGATFFFFFGLRIDPSTLPPALPMA